MSVQLRIVVLRKIAPLTLHFLPQVVILDQLCFGGLWTKDGYQRELESPNSDLLGVWELEGEGEEKLIGLGCLWAILDEAHITILGVHPAYRGQGLGRALLWSLLNSARQRGLAWATLEVRVSNQAALSLYTQFGFKEAGRRKGYYQDTGEDALILWRNGIQLDEFQGNLMQISQFFPPDLIDDNLLFSKVLYEDCFDRG